MRLRKSRLRIGRADDGVLPLINVVFLLLIFFMVAGRLTTSDPFVTEPLRVGLEGLAQDDAPLLLIAADGRLALDGAVIDRPTLVAAIAGVSRIRVKVDATADSVDVARLLAELRAAGVAEARLMVEHRSQTVSTPRQ